MTEKIEMSKLDGVKQAIEAKRDYYETMRKITEACGVVFPELSSETDRIHLYNGIDDLGLVTRTEPLLVDGKDDWGTETTGYIDGTRVYQLQMYGAENK